MGGEGRHGGEERHWVPCWAGLFVYDYAVLCTHTRTHTGPQARTGPGQGPEGGGGGNSTPMPPRFRNSSSMSRPARAESILVSAVVINALWAPPLADLANRAGSLPMRNQQQLQSGRARPRRTWVVSRCQDRRLYLIGSPRRTQGSPCLPGEGWRGRQAISGNMHVLVEDDWETGCLSLPSTLPPFRPLDARWFIGPSPGKGERAGGCRAPIEAGDRWLGLAGCSGPSV